MNKFLEKYKSIFHIFSFVPLAHMGVMLFVGEVYRRNYPSEALVQANQDPWVFFISLLIGIAGFSTLMLLLAHAYNSASFNKSLRILWISNLVLFGAFSIPVYFHRFILKPESPLNQDMELIQVLRFLGLFLVATGVVFFYRSNFIQPYMTGAF